ncbi:NFX1-type zinc finger-containing protein 1-like isoform X2 [Anguilla anguilla]|uniref:NFX1-type zinc finger-containing protein 1-like isoform X2 n=1 Tax=Anguilla anguilla TaxID=7936 RepID=UPI0015B31C9A|nr:NFX1-type zinc finger-containing protein 1-like isoform X2 [Anguilla anguilla]
MSGRGGQRGGRPTQHQGPGSNSSRGSHGRGGRPTQHQGPGSSSSRGSHGEDEHWRTGAPRGGSQNRRGGVRSQSHAREAEAVGRSPWRREHSMGRAVFQQSSPLSLDLTDPYNLAGSPVQSQERGRPVRAGDQFAHKDGRRGGRNKSQARTGNLSVHPMRNPSGVPATSVPKTPRNYRPPNDTRSHNATKNEHSAPRDWLGPSHRAVSQPNLSDLGHHSQGRERRARRGETAQDPAHKPSQRLDFRSLENILQMEPSEVVMKLAAPGSGLREFLDRKDTTDQLTHITLDVLSKACSCRTNRHNLQHLLSEVKDSQFLKTTIPMFLMTLGATLGMNDQDTREQNLARVKKIIDLHITLTSVFPSSTVIDVSMAVVLLEKELTNLQQAGVTIGEDVSESLGKLQNMAAHLQEKKRDGTLRSDNYSFLLGRQGEEGVEDFRLMSVFPTYEDMHATELPFLRPNIVGEKFQDGETYLDTHFRLLREDFIKPLRDGISQLLQFEGKDLRQRRFDDVRIYFNARILAPVCTPKGILYRVKFDGKNLKNINWESSKRLLFGALVCLSTDYFRTMIFATVANRDVKELQKGVTTVFFTDENRRKLADVSPSDVFLMVENMAFFEAYRHVLEGLQEMSVEDLPMQRYIVSCEEDISPPRYLLAHQHSYRLQALMNNNRLERQPLDFLSDTTKKQTVRDILNFSDWPSKEQLGLDDSQMKAVQLALTKELTIIQGPPGTGKTFVGLKIVKALLDNANVWRSAAGSPILVVCYTNHALDQFLEGILKFMSKSSVLVRVGGRSSNEALQELSLAKLRRQTNFMQKLPGYMRAMHAQLKEERGDLENRIESLAALLESSAKGVLHESVLKEYIFTLHGVMLEEGQLGGGGVSCRKKAQSLMLDWLGISMLSHSSRKMGDTAEGRDEQVGWEEGSCTNSVDDLVRVKEFLSVLEPLDNEDAMSDVTSVATEGDGDVADLLQVTEEAELVQAERIMEGDDMQQYIHSALDRMAAAQREVLAYVPKEDDKEEEEDEKGKEDADEGWEITREMKKKLKNVVKQELKKKDHMLEEEAEQITDLWALPYKQRWHLYRLWLAIYRREIRTWIISYENDYQRIVDRTDELRQQEDETVLRSASVIGMTTTCAARCRGVLQGIQPRIVVVEEAAEVLEAHIIAMLTSACQHLILIGDHQQLRPSTTVYELARNFNLEVSLFERLIRMDVPYVRLDYQHRMRPEIAQLLTPHIYDKLENHSSVHLYENIKGVATNIFFVDHDHLEEHIKEGRSHQNLHEATFVKALCYYLMLQGYKPSQITVLTTYSGQQFCLKNIMPKSTFQGVNLCVVDRYQGEENDIVILSLVRSNKEGKVGFLKIPNRVCVALSRAKKGLFCIGNMTMLSSVPLWSKIINVLSRNRQVGKALMLRCENHPATITAVSKPEDFLKVPLGGCSVPCEYRLDCGHVCTRLCHPTDSDHKLFKCTQPCTKTLCQDGHRCPKTCSEECGECQVIVTKTVPKCGHEQEVPCSQSLDGFICQVPCNKTLQCGHLCVRGCGESCTLNCPQKVKVPLGCGHQRNMQCHVKQEADNKQEPIKCWKKCDAELDCGHICSGSCFQCAGGSAHLPCASPCNAQLICFHQCHKGCNQGCAPCTKPCETQCYHRKCPKLCSEACPPCTAGCGWRCKHHQCTRLCHEPCDRPPCEVACYKKLKCGHSCIGMCGEPCPQKCRVCDAEEVSELFFGKEADPKARFVQLTDCNHIFEVTGFDSWMASPEESGAVRPKSCPKCRIPVRRSVRYNAFIKSTQLDVEVMKRKAAVMLAEHIQSVIKEKEKMGIKSPEIPPLLSKLTDADLGRVALISQQIELLSQLAEIKHSARLNVPMRHLLLINDMAHLCMTKVATAGPRQVSECETEVKRILCLAEAHALVGVYAKAQYPVLPAQGVTPEHPGLKDVIGKLMGNEPQLSKRDLLNVQAALDGFAKGMNPPTRWKMLEDTEAVSTVLSCSFLKLAHWFKCSSGHVYYRASADTGGQSELCPECLMTE